MHDIWNPRHGCTRVSEGCAHCYMFTMDRTRGLDGSVVRRNVGGFDYPLQRRRDGSLKVRPGELVRVCMTSDFLVPEADAWRDEAWDIIHQRPDVRFFILTKRPERFSTCLPRDWGDGWENVMLNVTCEDQRRTDERIPILLDTPAKHRGVMCAPLIGGVRLGRYLHGGEAATQGSYVEQVICGGENYEGSRPCDFGWVRRLHGDCFLHDTTFAFIETGSCLVKDGRTYRLGSKRLQSQQAHKSGMRHRGRPVEWRLTDNLGLPLPRTEWARPRFRARCATCGSLMICDGCSCCGRCGVRDGVREEKTYTLEELLGPEARTRETAVW